MDQLVTKIRGLQAAAQQAEDTRKQTQLAYYRAVEAAHDRLTEYHAAEHELLTLVVQQNQQLRTAVAAAQARTLPSIPEQERAVVEAAPEQEAPAEAAPSAAAAEPRK